MAHQPHQHLQREIDSLRKQLIVERDERIKEDAYRITKLVMQTEERIVERCIVECMEEANGALYSEEERIAILSAVERLKAMRSVNQTINQRDAMEHRRQRGASLHQQIVDEQLAKHTAALNQTIAQGILSGTHATHVWMDEMTDVSWGAVQPKETPSWGAVQPKEAPK